MLVGVECGMPGLRVLFNLLPSCLFLYLALKMLLVYKFISMRAGFVNLLIYGVILPIPWSYFQ